MNMENIFVEFLPPWVETGLQPAFYDKESGTVLQQTARMYARVNMLIRMFNKLSKNTKEVVENYIEQFNELHDYVHDYFDNLDVQEEINNKLDAMVEDGTMAEIINQEIFGELNDKVELLTKDKVLLLGDSYLQGYNGQTNVNSWGYYFKEASGLDDNHLKIMYESGMGFSWAGSGGHTYLTFLQANINSIADKDKYTDIIVGFGLNEHENSSSTITTAIGNFVTYAKAQFPNANIYLGMVGNLKRTLTAQNNNGRQYLYTRTFMAVKNASKFGVRYLTGVEQVAHDYTLFGSDDIHLSQDGYQAVGWAMYQAWKAGNYNYNSNFSGTQTITLGGDLVSPTNNLTGQVRITGVNRQIVLSALNITFTPFTVANAKIKLTADEEMANNSLFRSFGINNPTLPCQTKFTKSDNTTVMYPCSITEDINNGSVIMTVPSELNGAEIKGLKIFTDIFNLPTLLS